jgi:hypothetical protein
MITIDEADDCGQDTYRRNSEDYSTLARKNGQQQRLHRDYTSRKRVMGLGRYSYVRREKMEL